MNFKRRKVKLGSFVGLPAELADIFARMAKVDQLAGFVAVEALFLNYDPARGAHIEPHLDDQWLWESSGSNSETASGHEISKSV